MKHQLLEPLFDGVWSAERDPGDERAAYAFAAAGNDDVSALRETAHSLRRSWRAVVVWFCLCVGLALVYVLTATPQFSAWTEVVLEPRQPVATPDAAAASTTPALDSAQADSQVHVIQSERNLRYVFDTLGLASDPEFSSGGFDPIGWLLSRLPLPARSALVAGGGGPAGDRSGLRQVRRRAQRAPPRPVLRVRDLLPRADPGQGGEARQFDHRRLHPRPGHLQRRRGRRSARRRLSAKPKSPTSTPSCRPL